MKLMKNLCLFFLLPLGVWAQCSANTPVFTATGPGLAVDNRTKGCNAWALTWNSATFSGLTIQLEGSNDGVTYAAFSGASTVIVGTNPASTLSGAMVIQASSTLAFVRANVTALTGSGTVTYQLAGVSGVTPAAKGGGGSGGTCGALGGDLSGTCAAALVAKIQGTVVSGTTGSGNVVFSASPALTGIPTVPTASPGTSSTQAASTAFVAAAAAAGVTSFNTRTGAVVSATADYSVGQVTGAAPLASPTFTGVPVAPTAAPGTNTTQLATTAFVAAASGSSAFSALTNGTNTTAAMLVGTGASLAAAGSGTIAATTAAALAATPTPCSPGFAPTGVLANGNSTGCAAIDTGGTVAVSNVTPVTVSANTTSDQTLMELPLTSAFLNIATAPFLVHGSGIFTIATLQTPALTFKAKLCTVSGCGSGTVITLASIVTAATVAATNNPWNLNLKLATVTSGASGTVLAHGPLVIDIGAVATLAETVYNDTNTAASSAINLTGLLFIDFTVATSAGNTGNSFTQQIGTAEPSSEAGPPGATGATGPSGPSGGGITIYTSPAASGLTGTNTTKYIQIGGSNAVSGTESTMQMAAPSAATISNLFVTFKTAIGAGQTVTFTFRDGGSSQPLTCLVTGGAGIVSCSDTTHSFNAAQGDLLDIEADITGTIGSAPVFFITATFGTTGVGVTSVTASAPLASSGGTTPNISATYQGNGGKIQQSSGSTTTNDCVKFDASGNTVDAGAACGSGSSAYSQITGLTCSPACTASTSQIVLGSAAATISFSGIPATFTDLILVFNGRSATAGSGGTAAYIQYNADTGANYLNQTFFANNTGTTASAGPGLIAQAPVINVPTAGMTAGISANAEVTIFNYAATVFQKNATVRATFRTGGAAANLYTVMNSFFWTNSAVITSVLMGNVDASNFITGTTVTLYGRN